MATKRSPTRTESDDALNALSAQVRQVATALDNLHTQIEQLSKPIYDTGWPYPIGSMHLFSAGLQDWANTVQALAENPPTTPK